MKAKEIKERIFWVPSWGLSLLTALLSAIVVGVIKNYIEEPFTYIVWSLLIIVACFFICRNDPKSVWYVPVLSNILCILPAVFDDSFWTTSFGIIIGSGVLLSIIAAIAGASIGRRAVK
jgi:uncharacterized membrane protein